MNHTLSFYIIFLSLFLFACQSAEEATKDTSAEKTIQTDVPDYHSSRISIDYIGTYTGVLPCADCEGIETVITLINEDHYEIMRTYLGKDDDKVFTQKGTYKWDETGGIITLKGLDEPNQYRVGEDRLFKLDMEGKRIKGALSEMYILEKKQD